MPTYKRTTTVPASLAEVWEFHSTIDGLRALTPWWAGLTIEGVTGPDGRPNPEVLAAGSEIDMAIAPLGVSLTRWQSRITERTYDQTEAWFVDTAVAGPMPQWEHTHTFQIVADGTAIIDEVQYQLPSGLPAQIGQFGMNQLFNVRHQRYQQLFAQTASN